MGIAQCPMGTGAKMKFENVSLKKITLEDIREGNH